MLETIAFYVLPFSFTLLVACAMTSVVCGFVLLLLRLRNTNEVMRHPYLKQHPWERYPVSIRATILLDYFLRICFPNGKFWIIGQANRLLAHVQPTEVPSRIKWPLIGFWGGCFMGIFAMLLMWSMILLTMNT